MTGTDESRPFVRWAHQGGKDEAPPNTVAAMRRALRMGGSVGLELDVHLTIDQQLVVRHNRDLDGTTTGHGRVRRHRLADLQRAEVLRRSHATPDDPGAPTGDPAARVASLEQVLVERRWLGPAAPMTIEIKARAAAVPLIELLQREDWGTGSITVTSFRGGAVRDASAHLATLVPLVNDVEFAPGMGYLVGFWLSVLLGLPRRSTTYARLQIPRWIADRRIIEAAHDLQLPQGLPDRLPEQTKVDVWTVNDRATMRRLYELGVDGVMTDRPSVLRGLGRP